MTQLAEAIVGCYDALLAASPLLNELDSQAGDGDLGATLSIAVKAVTRELPELDGLELDNALQRCGMVIAREAPSTCGTLIATALLRAAQTVRSVSPVDMNAATRFAQALVAASEAVAQRGEALLGDKTMLDALLPAATAAQEVSMVGGSLGDALSAAARSAEDGARSTVKMVARHGRAAWLVERSQGHEDGGARAVATILAAIARTAGELPAAST